jgi:hypothetical protein
MSSWISASRPPKSKKVNPFVQFQVLDKGFCSQFNSYFYSYIYAKSKNLPLSVCDLGSCLGLKTPLLRNTFVCPDTVSFSDSMIPESFSIVSKPNEVIPSLLTYNGDTLREEAIKFFQFKPDSIEQIESNIKKSLLPPSFDVAVHIRGGDKIASGEMKAIKIDEYVNAVKDFSKKISSETLTVFVMTDDYTSFELFKAKADKTWLVYSLSSATSLVGHTQSQFNLQPLKIKQEIYNQFLTELYIAQRASAIVCTFSSHVGRFLFLTASPKTLLRSLDVPYFTPF